MHQDKNLQEELKYWNAMLRGDAQAFAKIYALYFKVLYNYGRKICPDASLVEDCIHDLFVDLWRYRQDLSATTSVHFYLYRSLRRRLVKRAPSHFIRHDDHDRIEGVLPLRAQSQKSQIIENEPTSQLRDQMQRFQNDLPSRRYEALVLYFYDGFSYAEVASMLDVNEQSARHLVQRGLAQLRNLVAMCNICLLLWSPSAF